ncbi:MAG: hypothetical protein ABI210_07035 [Abditibacteriaceae bacterium]
MYSPFVTLSEVEVRQIQSLGKSTFEGTSTSLRVGSLTDNLHQF